MTTKSETKQQMHDRILEECKADLNYTGRTKHDFNPNLVCDFLVNLNDKWYAVNNRKLQEVKLSPPVVQVHE